MGFGQRTACVGTYQGSGTVGATGGPVEKNTKYLPEEYCVSGPTLTMSAPQQQRYRNFSIDSLGRERLPSDETYYQGMLKATDGRKGTSMVPLNVQLLCCNL